MEGGGAGEIFKGDFSVEKKANIPLVVVKEGPRFRDALAGGEPRNNKISSSHIKSSHNLERVTHTFSEREGLENLREFIDKTAEVARRSGDEEMLEMATGFRDNLRFIGETELQQAVAGMAAHVLELAQSGNIVYLFPPSIRSEQYICMRMLEEFDSLTEGAEMVRSRVKIMNDVKNNIDKCAENKGRCKVIIPDDFSISGTEITGSASNLLGDLIDAGFTQDEALSAIEANLVAVAVRKAKGLTVSHRQSDTGEYADLPLNVWAYYGVDEYFGKDGKWVTGNGVSVTGSHCSVDYGFETTLNEMHEFLERNGEEVEIPLLYQVHRPYQTEGHGSRYADPQLQERWEKIQRKYLLV